MIQLKKDEEKENKMERIRVADNFFLDEFVDPFTYFHDPRNGLGKIDHQLFDIAQKLRDLDGKPKVINNWWGLYKHYEKELTCNDIIKLIEESPAHRKWSGYRPEHCPIGAKLSAHRSGQAIDMVGNGLHLFGLIKENAQEFYNLGVRRLEDPSITPTWLHVDTLERNTQPNSIRVVDLKYATEIIHWK